MCPRWTTVIALAAISVATASCSSGNNLSRNEAASLIQKADNSVCEARKIYANSAEDPWWEVPVDTNDSTVVRNFLEEELPNLGFQRVNDVSRGSKYRRLFEVQYASATDGSAYFVSKQYSKVPTREFLALTSVSACVFLITGINVLDVTVDKETGKSATVIYTQVETPSAVAADLGKPQISSLLDRAAFLPKPEQQYRAELRYLDQGGWQVSKSEVPVEKK